MSDTTFYYIIGGLAAILAVLLFNSYKEKRYRDEVRRQFGHSDQDALLEEVATLNKRVTTLMKEKDEILAMKVSQLGLKPGDSSTEEVTEQKEEDTSNLGIRFSKLNENEELNSFAPYEQILSSFVYAALCSRHFLSPFSSPPKFIISIDKTKIPAPNDGTGIQSLHVGLYQYSVSSFKL